MVNSEKYIKFITEHKLTHGQYFFLQICYEGKTDLLHLYKRVFSIALLPVTDVEDLVIKGFIVKTKTGFNITNKFRNIFVDADKAVQEIFDLYPSFITNSQGVRLPLKAMDRRIFKEIYLKKIQGNLEEHKEILLDIQYGIDNNLITMGISKFLTSQFWESFRHLRKPTNRTNTIKPSQTDDWDEDF